MPHKAIQIRDQIATQITDTSANVYTSRAYAVDEANLPAVVVEMGSFSVERESFADDFEHWEQDYTLRIFVKDGTDVDAVLYDRIKAVLELLGADPTLSGLAQDSFPTSGIPEIAKGTEALAQCEITYRAIYATDPTNL